MTDLGLAVVRSREDLDGRDRGEYVVLVVVDVAVLGDGADRSGLGAAVNVVTGEY